MLPWGKKRATRLAPESVCPKRRMWPCGEKKRRDVGRGAARRHVLPPAPRGSLFSEGVWGERAQRKDQPGWSGPGPAGPPGADYSMSI